MFIEMTGDKKDVPEQAQPARRQAPQRDGQGGGDTIPSSTAPVKEPPTN